MSKRRADEISLHRDGIEFLAGLVAEALEEDDHLGAEEITDYVAGRMDEDCPRRISSIVFPGTGSSPLRFG